MTQQKNNTVAEGERALAEDLFEEIWRAVRGPYNSIQTVAMGEWAALQYLDDQKNSVSPTELSRFFNVSTARAAAVVNQLEKRGYVRRAPAPEDRRRVRLLVTEEGARVARGRKRAIVRYLQKLIDALGEEDAKTYIRLSRRVIDFGREHPVWENGAIGSLEGMKKA